MQGISSSSIGGFGGDGSDVSVIALWFEDNCNHFPGPLASYDRHMTIRPAKPDDVPAVLPMVRKLVELHASWNPAKYAFKQNVTDMYSRWLPLRADDPRSVFLIAERENKLIAFLIGTVESEIPIYTLKEFGFIHDLWVQEDYRHEGIARQMVMLAIESFRNIGVSQVRLDTASQNEPARSLFRSCGFQPSTVEMLLEIHLPGEA